MILLLFLMMLKAKLPKNNFAMKHFIYVFLFCFINIFVSCGKNDTSQEIKIKKSEANGDSELNAEVKKDTSENKSSGETSALQKITSKEVKKHIGDSLRITGYIADIYLGEKVAYLNFENKFPKNVFSCAIFSGKFDEFGDLSKFKNRTAEVTGRITTYKNKPQIILESKDQIKIIE